MTNDEFQQIIKARLEKVNRIIDKKNTRQYAVGGDPHHNFITSGRIKGETSAQALWGMVVKHLSAQLDMINGDAPITLERIEEVVGDIIVYEIILETIFVRKLREEEK